MLPSEPLNSSSSPDTSEISRGSPPAPTHSSESSPIVIQLSPRTSSPSPAPAEKADHRRRKRPVLENDGGAPRGEKKAKKEAIIVSTVANKDKEDAPPRRGPGRPRGSKDKNKRRRKSPVMPNNGPPALLASMPEAHPGFFSKFPLHSEPPVCPGNNTPVGRTTGTSMHREQVPPCFYPSLTGALSTRPAQERRFEREHAWPRNLTYHFPPRLSVSPGCLTTTPIPPTLPVAYSPVFNAALPFESSAARPSTSGVALSSVEPGPPTAYGADTMTNAATYSRYYGVLPYTPSSLPSPAPPCAEMSVAAWYANSRYYEDHAAEFAWWLEDSPPPELFPLSTGLSPRATLFRSPSPAVGSGEMR
ncbi:hypothetical protein BD413DRAFT_494816 [Trametes elegans]|nr:hypothetical protein BD413DRAFT_494816 [Trametes elegans]